MAGRDADGGQGPGTPRWVKMIGIVVAVVVLLVAVAKLTGIGGEHGPGRHVSGGPGSAVPAGGAAWAGP